jgi:hypothetical protein
MKFDAIVMAFVAVINSQSQIAEFEKYALASVRRRPASSFDEGLPERPFASWFRETVGERAGVFWQLSECDYRCAGKRGVSVAHTWYSYGLMTSKDQKIRSRRPDSDL